MGLIASSSLPGYEALHRRVCDALSRCKELKDVDFKESASWSDLKWKIIKTAIAMGNLRDGGIIIVGVSQRNKVWKLTGISPEHFETYDVDEMTDQLNAYISPSIEITPVSVEYFRQRFLVIAVDEFLDTPLVCKKHAPNEENLRKGFIYIRPPGKPATTQVNTAEQMHDLLELAAEKRARRILEVSRRVGLVPSAAAEERFDKEIQNLSEQLPAPVMPILKLPHWRIILRPEFYEAEAISSLSDCDKLIDQTRVRTAGWKYPCEPLDSPMRIQGSNWIGSWLNFTCYEYWRFYQSLQFIQVLSFWNDYEKTLKDLNKRRSSSSRSSQTTALGIVSVRELVYRTTQVFEFAARLCSKGFYRSSINISLELDGVEGFVLTEPENFWFYNTFYQSSESFLHHTWTMPSDDLIANASDHAITAVRWFAERFGWLDPSADAFKKTQQDFFSY